MYKVLLADDEKVILHGISTLVDWEKLGTRLIGTALDGEMALEMIEREPPDIVISDIKMSGMDGLRLIREVRQRYPHIRFIILSGYEQFDFAKQAMEYGVKHYLLKPCNERKIADVLTQVVTELKEEEEKETFVRTMRYNLEKVMPQVKEQLLRELLTNKTYGPKDWEFYRNLLSIEFSREKVKLLLLEIEGEVDFEHVFALKNIANELIGEIKRVLLSTSIADRVALLMENIPDEMLNGPLKRLKQVYKNYYGKSLTIAISEAGEIGQLRQLYKQCQECLTHRFYVGEGSVISHKDIKIENDDLEDFSFDHENLILAIRSGNVPAVEEYIQQFFARLRQKKIRIDLSKSYTMELFMIIIRQAEPNAIDAYWKQIMHLEGMTTLDQFEAFIMDTAKQVTQATFEAHAKTNSQVVRKMKESVQKYLDDETFSLNKLANDIMFMNADYLGKLFKRETGQRFTNYLVQARIERAKQLIRESDEVKVFEIAEKVGYGNNPQYFSQVFKKMTGQSPSGFKKQSM